MVISCGPREKFDFGYRYFGFGGSGGGSLLPSAAFSLGSSLAVSVSFFIGVVVGVSYVLHVSGFAVGRVAGFLLSSLDGLLDSRLTFS